MSTGPMVRDGFQASMTHIQVVCISGGVFDWAVGVGGGDGGGGRLWSNERAGARAALFISGKTTMQ